MDLGGLAGLVLQALCQACFAQRILAQQLSKVHLDGVLQHNVVLIRDQ